MNADSSSNLKYRKMAEDKDLAKEIFNNHLNGLGTGNTSHFGQKAIEAMQQYGNQRFNAALSEAIEKIETEYIYSDKIFQAKTVIEILEGLKIKP